MEEGKEGGMEEGKEGGREGGRGGREKKKDLTVQWIGHDFHCYISCHHFTKSVAVIQNDASIQVILQ